MGIFLDFRRNILISRVFFKIIYVFTSDEKRNASQELVALYEAEMTRFKQPEAMETDDTGIFIYHLIF